MFDLLRLIHLFCSRFTTTLIFHFSRVVFYFSKTPNTSYTHSTHSPVNLLEIGVFMKNNISFERVEYYLIRIVLLILLIWNLVKLVWFELSHW